MVFEVKYLKYTLFVPVLPGSIKDLIGRHSPASVSIGGIPLEDKITNYEGREVSQGMIRKRFPSCTFVPFVVMVVKIEPPSLPLRAC